MWNLNTFVCEVCWKEKTHNLIDQNLKRCQDCLYNEFVQLRSDDVQFAEAYDDTTYDFIEWTETHFNN